jgi:hypothetical protein
MLLNWVVILFPTIEILPTEKADCIVRAGRRGFEEESGVGKLGGAY